MPLVPGCVANERSTSGLTEPSTKSRYSSARPSETYGSCGHGQYSLARDSLRLVIPTTIASIPSDASSGIDSSTRHSPLELAAASNRFWPSWA